jgi:hypothetical protein
MRTTAMTRTNKGCVSGVFSTLIGGATPVEALAVTTDVLSNTYVVGNLQAPKR